MGLLLCMIVFAPCRAEVVTDGTQGTALNLPGPAYAVDAELGRLEGSNLFHSFSAFNLAAGESALFSGPESVTNIISRVTGGTPSLLDGRIASDIAGADFYFLNPAGVMFGPGATLDLSGGFYVSSADYLRLGTDGRFDARTPAQSVFSAAPPVAFGFVTEQPAAIRKQGSVLHLPAGETLLFAGGDLAFDDSAMDFRANPAVAVTDGNLALLSAAGPGEFALPGSGGENSVTTLGDITIKDTAITSDNSERAANLDASGPNGGRIFIRGGNLHLTGAYVWADTQGEGSGAGIVLLLDGEFSAGGGSRITTEALREAGPASRAGDISVQAGEVRLADGSQLAGDSRGSARAGDITVSARHIELSGEGVKQEGSGFDSASRGRYNPDNGAGDGGRITLQADSLILRDGAQITSTTSGYGAGGEVVVEARSLSVLSAAKLNVSTANIGDPRAKGQPGDLHITAERVRVNGGAITSEIRNQAAGGGNIDFTATVLEMSAATMQSNSKGKGRAGDIELAVGRLEIIENSVISTDTQGADGGNITLNSPGYAYLGNNSKISSSAGSSGDGGNLTLTPEFVVLDEGFVLAQTVEGHGGQVNITATGVYNFADPSGDRIEEYINAEATGGGIDGIVEIDSPEVDISGSLVVLPGSFIDDAALRQSSCTPLYAAKTSRFIVRTSRAGVSTQGRNDLLPAR